MSPKAVILFISSIYIDRNLSAILFKLYILSILDYLQIRILSSASSIISIKMFLLIEIIQSTVNLFLNYFLHIC
jgi:hypothetical protein